MGVLKERWRHAFAVDPEGPVDPTPEQQTSVDWVCLQVAKRHLTTPGVLFLEMSRPLNWVGAQMLHMFAPAVWAIARQQNHEQFQHFVRFLEQRGSVSYLTERIEHFDNEFEEKKKAALAKAKEDARDGSS